MHTDLINYLFAQNTFQFCPKP